MPRSSRHERDRSADMDLISIAIATALFITVMGVIWALERV
jgi:hypothetical protein